MSAKYIIYEDDQDGPMFVTHIIDGEVGQFNWEHEACRFDSFQEADEVCLWLNAPDTFHSAYAEFKVREVAA